MNDDVFTVTDIEQAIDLLKFGKASGFDGLTKEHITFSHPAIVLHMKFVFTMIYKHGFVPDDFGKGLCVPLLKDRSGDHSALDNYRPVSYTHLTLPTIYSV